MRVLGIDPGTRCVGYGLIEVVDGRYTAIDYGVFRIDVKRRFPERLEQIYASIFDLLQRVRPDAVAVEEVYVSRNAKTTLRLGHARGVVLLAAVKNNVRVAEYAPRKVKQSVVGQGNASKEQVQRMISQILNVPFDGLEEDAADALAAALRHGLRCRGLGDAVEGGEA